MVLVTNILMDFKGENLTFLLGAGASVEAGIPVSSQMVTDIENLITEDPDWKPYRDLYYYLKSSIQYADGIFGNFNNFFNVEQLLFVINSLEERDHNIMYPFIGTWNMRLTELAGPKFEKITEFKKLIVRQLNQWVKLRNYNDANYYSGFAKLQENIGHILKVFTLNYDLCFEKQAKTGNSEEHHIEVGFDTETRDWHYSNFEPSALAQGKKSFCLYKLHGSINWYLDKEDKKLKLSDDAETIPELIFGIQHKLTSTDPYFFYSSELRRHTLDNDCKLFITVGYSFSDDYINKIIIQGLKEKPHMTLMVVGRCKENQKDEKTKILCDLLGVSQSQIEVVVTNGAKDFLQNKLTTDFLSEYIKDSEDAPF